MPIHTGIPIYPFSQSQFGPIAYEVMGHAYAIHKELGPIFNETAYRNTLAHILAPRAVTEVCIRLTHADFEKRVFIDLVVDQGCPFELKVAGELHNRHRQQLIQYLMLSGLNHGKLINFGADRVQHEFVNCHESTSHRRSFQIDLERWTWPSADACRLQEIVTSLLHDWGTGLDRWLYIEAVTYFLGGPEVVQQPMATLWDGIVVGSQDINLVCQQVGFEISCLRRDLDLYEKHLQRFLAHTTLKRILWVNIVSGCVRFVVLEK